MKYITRIKSVSRRKVLKTMAAAGAAMAAPTLFTKPFRRAQAATPGTIRMMGGPTVALENWDQFEKDTGLKMEFTPFHVDDVGALMTEVVTNGAGERLDIISTLAGVQKGLIDKGQVAPLDTSKLKNYAGISDLIKRNSLLYKGDNKDWGLPFIMNADAFGYFPSKLNLPRPPELLNWDLLLNSEKTKGQCAMEADQIMLMIGGMYMKTRKLAEIGDPANMNPGECKTVADWMIERKKAGQFRTFWKSYDEQVANFVNGEVLVQRCWEPAQREAKRQGVDVEYAFCSDYHVNWMHAAFITASALQRGNVDEVYRALDWFNGGSYCAGQAVRSGYAGARMDLGMDFVTAQKWPDDKVALVKANMDKVKFKFSNPNFWISGLPDDMKTHEAEAERFRNA
jgi:putative spermidine/putrescine transport system substrate-binding protein